MIVSLPLWALIIICILAAPVAIVIVLCALLVLWLIICVIVIGIIVGKTNKFEALFLGKSQKGHGLMRMKTRAGVSNQKQATQIIKSASKKGLSPNYFEAGSPFREYLRTKEKGKRIKVYKGYIYIFKLLIQ